MKVPDYFLPHKETVKAALQGEWSSLRDLAWELNNKLQTKEHTLLFIDFNEHRQRYYVKPSFYDWCEQLLGELAENKDSPQQNSVS